jgi:hypothetical protein
MHVSSLSAKSLDHRAQEVCGCVLVTTILGPSVYSFQCVEIKNVERPGKVTEKMSLVQWLEGHKENVTTEKVAEKGGKGNALGQECAELALKAVRRPVWPLCITKRVTRDWIQGRLPDKVGYRCVLCTSGNRGVTFTLLTSKKQENGLQSYVFCLLFFSLSLLHLLTSVYIVCATPPKFSQIQVWYIWYTRRTFVNAAMDPHPAQLANKQTNKKSCFLLQLDLE